LEANIAQAVVAVAGKTAHEEAVHYEPVRGVVPDRLEAPKEVVHSQGGHRGFVVANNHSSVLQQALVST
jgi:hypothetical protein